MAIKNVLALFVFVFTGLSAVAQDDSSAGELIVLSDPLDEPEFYCFDLAGWGQNLLLDDPLQAHTCKTRNADDQMFHFEDNRLKVSTQDLCVQVAGSTGKTLAGSAVLARPCVEDNPLQDLSWEDGQVQVGGTGFCIGVGSVSAEAGGPSHVWRTLGVVHCESHDDNLLTWQRGL